MMRDPQLRASIVVLGMATALIHLSLNMPPSIGPGLIFTANGLGYLALVGAFALDPPIVRRRSDLLRYAFLAYTLLTIVGWVAIGERSALAYVDKAIEIALVIALWRYAGARPQANASPEVST